MSFSFVGSIPASKSLFNRFLICQSYCPELKVIGQTEADDVVLMQKALADISTGQNTLNCGLAGTVFRFLALRVARLGGEWHLKAESELLQRPHQGLRQLLGQLSVDEEWTDQGLTLRSDGWRLQGDALHVSMQTSSQFLSSVLLNSWNLEKDLFVVVNSRNLSQGYYQMTLDIVRRLGMAVEENGNEIRIPARSTCLLNEVAVEPDLSSAFALATVGVIDGDVTIRNFPWDSLQPDVAFVDILESMGVTIQRSTNDLRLVPPTKLHGGQWNLSSCPDLFPSLAVLAALAEGESRLYGAPHLRYKESNRIAKVMELLRPLGRDLKELDDGIQISGSVLPADDVVAWTFETSGDHRMAMAAAALLKAGYKVKIQDPHVVSKSFPEFWDVIGEAP